jgi:hypothetical protein
VNPAIINFGKGAWYPRGQDRLRKTLADVNFKGTFYGWNEESEVGAPPHSVVPYAFKINAFRRALEAGHDVILWLDAAVWAYKDPQPVFEWIKEHGYYLCQSGFHVSQWTSDACLSQCGVTRDEADGMLMYMACCMGFDFTLPESRTFLDRLEERAKDGISFPGCWSNHNHEVSQDPRCQGHRHDQSAGSIIAAQMGMKPIISHTGPAGFFQYYENPQHTAFVYGRDNDMSLVKQNVCLLTQGM